VRFYIWAAVVVIADQATKFLAVHFLHPIEPIKLIPPFFWLILRHNSGAAFSLFSDHGSILIIFTCLAAGFVIWWGISLPRQEKLLRTALGMIAGGALGNVIDRLFRDGLVVDFLDLHWMNKLHWPTFNIADTAICIGVGLIVLDSIVKMRREAQKKDRSKTRPAPRKKG